MLELLPTTSTGVLYQLIRHSLMKGISHKYFNKLKHEPQKRFSYLHNQCFSTWQFSVYLNLISIAVILLLAPCKWRKKTELWTRIKASLLLSYTGTNLSAAVQPWTKKLKAWIPQPSREAHTARRAGTSCHCAARRQVHLYKSSPSRLRLPASRPITTANKTESQWGGFRSFED